MYQVDVKWVVEGDDKNAIYSPAVEIDKVTHLLSDDESLGKIQKQVWLSVFLIEELTKSEFS
jgi:hypothetical protein